MIITEIPTQLLTNNWITATWDEYIQVIENFADKKAKSYYHHGKMRIEISPIGNDHACYHSIIIFAVNLFATIKGIKFNSKDNCTYRKIGFQEVQPDVSYYRGFRSYEVHLKPPPRTPLNPPAAGGRKG